MSGGGAGDAPRHRDEPGSLPDREHRSSLRAVLALVLTVVAGFVVAVGIRTLVRVEVGPMSGNTATTGLRLGEHGVDVSFGRLVVVPAFVLGVAAGVALLEVLGRRAFGPALAATVGVEIVCLAAFMAWGHTLLVGGHVHASNWVFDGLICLPAAAMGLQTAALRRVDGKTVRTVYMSGMLSRFAEEGVRLLFARHDRAHGGASAHWPHHPSRRRVALLAALWVGYLGGAVLGAALDARWTLWSLGVPLALLAAVVVVDVSWPVHRADAPYGVGASVTGSPCPATSSPGSRPPSPS